MDCGKDASVMLRGDDGEFRDPPSALLLERV